VEWSGVEWSGVLSQVGGLFMWEEKPDHFQVKSYMFLYKERRMMMWTLSLSLSLSL